MQFDSHAWCAMLFAVKDNCSLRRSVTRASFGAKSLDSPRNGSKAAASQIRRPNLRVLPLACLPTHRQVSEIGAVGRHNPPGNLNRPPEIPVPHGPKQERSTPVSRRFKPCGKTQALTAMSASSAEQSGSMALLAYPDWPRGTSTLGERALQC